MMAKYKNVCRLARGIPAGVVAGGMPCKVIRPITEADRIKPEEKNSNDNE